MSRHRLRMSAIMRTAAFTPTVHRESQPRQILTPVILPKTPHSSISRWLPWLLWPPWPQWQRVQASSHNYSKIFYIENIECVSEILCHIFRHHIGLELFPSVAEKAVNYFDSIISPKQMSVPFNRILCTTKEWLLLKNQPLDHSFLWEMHLLTMPVYMSKPVFDYTQEYCVNSESSLSSGSQIHRTSSSKRWIQPKGTFLLKFIQHCIELY